MPNRPRQALTKSEVSSASRPAPWTASRCIRTLRQLTSLLSKLEKWHKDYPDGCSECGNSATGPDEIGIPRDDTISKKRQHVISTISRNRCGDPDWLPVQGKTLKRRLKKYRGSARQQIGYAGNTSRTLVRIPKTPRPSKIYQPGEIPIDTPLIAGTQNTIDEPISDHASRPQRHNSFKQRVLHRYSLPLTDYDGVTRPLEIIVSSFLEATAASTVAGTGVRSLSVMCQRRLPDCILEEQKRHNLQKKDVADDYDISSLFFTELEDSFSPALGTGWVPLREIVRAHGLRLIGDSIQKRLLRTETSKQLIIQSLRLGATDAFEAFAEALLKNTCDYAEAPSNDGAYLGESKNLHFLLGLADSRGALNKIELDVRKLRVIEQMRRYQGCVGIIEGSASDILMLRKCASLLSLRNQDSWLAASLIKTAILHGLVPHHRTLDQPLPSLRAKNSENMEIGTQASRNGYGPPAASRTSGNLSEEVEQTVRSLCIILCSIVLTHPMTDESRQSTAVSTIMEMFQYFDVWTRKDREINHMSNAKDSMSAIYLHVSHFLLAGDWQNELGETTLENIEYAISSLESPKDHLASSASFLLDVTFCCGRVQRNDGFEILKRLTENIFATNDDRVPNTAVFLRYAASNAAMTFAQARKQDFYFQWVSHVQARLAAFLHGDRAKKPLSLGLLEDWRPYHWDYSIEEWIEETPALAKVGARKQHVETDMTATPSRTSVIASSLMQAYTQETPTPDLLTLPSPPVTSPPSPSDFSQRPILVKRSSHGADIMDLVERSCEGSLMPQRAVKRTHSCEDTAELQMIHRRHDAKVLKQERRKRRKRASRARVALWSDDDEGRDELAATPAAKMPTSGPRSALTAIQNPRFAKRETTRSNNKKESQRLRMGPQEDHLESVSNNESEDELG